VLLAAAVAVTALADADDLKRGERSGDGGGGGGAGAEWGRGEWPSPLLVCALSRSRINSSLAFGGEAAAGFE
jgi:hypothetical protein